MTTRFDSNIWITAQGERLALTDMETAHLLNTLKMLVTKPERTISMLVADIELYGEVGSCLIPWAKEAAPVAIKHSLHSITSMTADETRVYALHSTLGRAIRDELVSRGVNVESYVSFLADIS